jgi:tetratricopeptide (TPR) repeat protein
MAGRSDGAGDNRQNADENLQLTGNFHFRKILQALALLLFCSAAVADQTDERLPGLFDDLESASDTSTAQAVEGKIWQLWLVAPDENSYLLMSQLTRAMSSGQLKIALTLADQLIDGAPEFAEAWNKRATIHYLMGNNDASVADIHKTLSLEPRHFGAISGLGLIFMRQGNMEAALEAFEQVLLISPASSSAQRSVDRVRQELGREI